ncbi:nephrin-like [Scylla paramamosain]|uniref:nephrin-like n=1 Tax=Scylla paramamosain TaxID=85552 RepID=UPI0030833691
MTYSTLTLSVTRADHLHQVTCRASNPLLRESAVEDVFTLNVLYKPSLRLLLGRSLRKDNLQESNDIFFECQIEANPDPYKIEWWHDGQLVSHNLSGGVIVSQTTLAVQKAQRERSGEYKCSASNVEGDAMSNPLVISIKYAPRCTVSPSLRGAPLREPLNLTCRVDADPPDVQFTWTFNNSVRRDKVFGENRYTSHKLQSVLRYTPTSERDYGTLLCYARNTVGPQEVPCSFTVVSAGPPEEVGACGVDNITSHSVTVSCTAGFNGGLPQRFSIQVWAVSDVTGSPKLVSNMSEAAAEFLVRSLHPGQHYRAEVTAYNKRGTAQPVQVMIYTLKEAEMHKSLPSRSEPSAIMLVVAVLGGAVLVVVSCLMAGVWGVRGCRRAGCRREVMQGQEGEDVTTRVLVECNPDILETAPPLLTTTSTPTTPTTHPITISIIKTPLPLPPRPLSYEAPPSGPTSPDPALVVGREPGDRRGSTLPNPKTSLGLQEPLHRPIEESLQRSLRGLSSQHLA